MSKKAIAAIVAFFLALASAVHFTSSAPVPVRMGAIEPITWAWDLSDASTLQHQTVVGLENSALPSLDGSTGCLEWSDAGAWVFGSCGGGSSGITGLRQAFFGSSGTWTAPTGVTQVVLVGAGGGGGGAGASNVDTSAAFTGGSGGGSIEHTSYASVVAGNVYTVTIGSGGTGGAGNQASGNSGNDGNDTSFAAPTSSNILFLAMGAGHGVFPGAGSYGGTNNRTFVVLSPISGVKIDQGIGFGNYGGKNPSVAGYLNDVNGNVVGQTSFIAGVGGSQNITTGCFGGPGGGQGPAGNGGNGGNGATPGNPGSSGTSGGANTGAGGGAGGNGDTGHNGGAGGAGGSGYLYVIY